MRLSARPRPEVIEAEEVSDEVVLTWAPCSKHDKSYKLNKVHKTDISSCWPVAEVTPPASLIHEVYEGVDVGPATPAPHYGGALDHWEVGQIFEGMDQNPQGQAGFLQQRVSLRYFR